jgi:transposase
MLSQEDDVQAHALQARGWSISAIARHLGKDRKTVRAYLNGDRVAGARKAAGPDRFEPFTVYCRARLTEDPHLWATTLFDEVTALGFAGSYPSFTRALRARGLRPHCEPCHPAAKRPVAVIEHPPAQEVQWDWLELPDPPGHWDGYRGKAFLLVGALSHSGKWRGRLYEAADQAHLVDGLHQISGELGGLPNCWRFDRMSSVADHRTRSVTATFASVAKHYGITVALCPPRRGNRKGVVEKANHVAAQRWWRTLPDDISLAEAQQRLDTWCATKGDGRRRVVDEQGTRLTVAQIAAGERLRPLPASPFPATVTVSRTVRPQALVSFRGNRYSVPPELVGTAVTVSHRLGSPTVEIAVAGGQVAGTVVAAHHRAGDGAGVTIRTDTHVTALNRAALQAFTTASPHRGKVRIPPGAEALAAAAVLRGDPPGQTPPTVAASTASAVVDLAVYAEAAARRRNLS